MDNEERNWNDDLKYVTDCVCKTCSNTFKGRWGRMYCRVCDTARKVDEDKKLNDETSRAIRAMERDMTASVIGYDMEEYMYDLSRQKLNKRNDEKAR